MNYNCRFTAVFWLAIIRFLVFHLYGVENSAISKITNQDTFWPFTGINLLGFKMPAILVDVNVNYFHGGGYYCDILVIVNIKKLLIPLPGFYIYIVQSNNLAF